MRNIEIYDMHRIQLTRRLHQLEALQFINGSVFFVDNGTLYYFFDEEAASPLCEKQICITDLIYIPTLEHVWFGTGSEFVFVHVKTLDVRIVATPDLYIAASWSPSFEHIVICKEDGNVKCYCNCFDEPTTSKTFEEEARVPLADGVSRAYITWRKNSEEFSVVYFDDSYKLRVYNVRGQILAKTVAVDNLLPHVTWKGSMIFLSRFNDEGRCLIALYEKNGLFHDEFELDKEVTDVDKMAWDEMGNMLAINILTRKGSFLNIFMQVNFKFELKQQIPFTNENPLEVFEFTQSNKHMFALLMADKETITFMKFLLKVQTGVLPSGLGFYLNVDGKRLQFKRIDGDRLAGREDDIQVIKTDVPINQIAFHHTYEKFIIIDSYSNVILFLYIEDEMIKIGRKIGAHDANSPFLPLNFYNYCFVNRNEVLASYLGPANEHDIYNLELEDFDMIPFQLNDHVKYIHCVHEYGQMLKLKNDGIVYLNDHQHIVPLPNDLRKIDYVIVDGEFYLMTLDVMDNMRVNSNLLCKSVNSFIYHAGYLFIVAFMNKLYCIRLQEQYMRSLCNQPLYKSKFPTRACEDGSMLLSGVPDDLRVVLWHPRGNTETILCRSVALDRIVTLVNDEDWKAAYQYIRAERMDFNLLIDINPQNFLNKTRAFIDSIEIPQLLQLFVLAISDENVLKTTYKYYIDIEIDTLENKKETICQEILKLTRPDLKKWIKVAVLAANGIGGVPSAIELLYNLYIGLEDVDVLVDGIQSISQYLSPEEIRKVCLVKADLTFIEYVFQNMNDDPKIYETLFRDVRGHKSNTYMQFFLIQDSIENYKEALEYYINSCMYLKVVDDEYKEDEDVDKLIEYANTHDLLTTLYKCCIKHNFHNKKIINSYADKLCSEGRYEEAAFIFRANFMWVEAFNCFLRSKLWNEALQVLDHVDGNKSEYLLSLAKTLKAHGNYKDAASIYERYLLEPDQAINCLVNARLYSQAINLARKHQKEHLIETTIRREYMFFYGTLMDKIDSATKRFTEYFQRLEILRTNMATDGIPSTSRGKPCGTLYAESVAGSMASASTSQSKYSSSSAARQRKLEKKKQNLRPGNDFENIALIRALHDIIRENYNLCPEVKTMCGVLISYEADGLVHAKLLQDFESTFLSMIVQLIPIIWPANLNTLNVEVTPELRAIRHNLDHLVHSRFIAFLHKNRLMERFENKHCICKGKFTRRPTALDVVNDVQHRMEQSLTKFLPKFSGRAEMKYRYPPEPGPSNWKLGMLDDLIESDSD